MAAPWDRRTAAEHRRIQDTLLVPWIAGAATYSPFWEAYLRDAGVEPRRVETVDGLEQVPPVRELDVRDAGGPGSPALVLRPTEEQLKSRGDFRGLVAIARGIRRGGEDGKRRAFLTEFKPIHLVASGRDGQLALAYARADLDRLHRAGARSAAILGLTDRDYVVSAVPAGDSLAFWGVRHLALGASILAAHPRGAGEPLDVALGGFALVPATAVVVPVREAVELAELVEDSGVDASGVRTVITVGPPPTDKRRRAIAEAWGGAAVVALWAPNGGRTLWAECPESVAAGAPSGLHLYPDLDIVELLDPASGRRVPRGAGDVTLTSVGWNGTALVRYQTGDYASGLDTDPCPGCGRTVPRLQAPVVPGAWQPLLDGTTRLDLRGAAAVLAAEPAVEAWRVEVRGASGRQKQEGYVAVVAGRIDEETLRDLDGRLTRAVGHPPRQLVVDDADAVRAHVSEVGAVFEDAR